MSQSHIEITFTITGTVSMPIDGMSDDDIKLDIDSLIPTIKEISFDHESIEIISKVDPSKIFDYTLPEWVVPAIFNDDKSNLSIDEERVLNRFIWELPESGVWSVTGEPYFSNTNDLTNDRGNVVDMTYTIP